MTEPLSTDLLRRTCDPSHFDFETTAELDGEHSIVGQDRAREAIEFGVEIDSKGYNIFAMGTPGTGRRRLVDQLLEEAAQDQAAPPDWCYVNNFDDRRSPRALELPPGRGVELRNDVQNFIDEIKRALPATFESEEYQTRLQLIQDEVRQGHEDALEEFRERASEENIAVLRTPQGFVFAPIRDGDVVPPEEFQALPEEEQKRVRANIEELQDELQDILRKVPQQQREVQERIRELNQEMAGYAVDDLVDRLHKKYEGLKEVQEYLNAVRTDIVDNVDALLNLSNEKDDAESKGAVFGEGGPWRRYRVNLIVDHGKDDRAPVVFEDNPTYQHLIGQVEQIARMGALVTDFNLIKAGALHRANGGYLVVEARKLLMHPYAWEGLKRALQAEELEIESAGEALGLIRTVTLDPEPIPLDVKVVLVGSRLVYYLLSAFDPDMAELFKVMADFDEEVDRNDAETGYARMLAAITKRENLRPLDRTAVARVIDRGARLVSDSEKLSTHMRSISDLLREADYRAGKSGRDVISAEHVQEAIDAKVRRADRLRERIYEAIERDSLYVSTEGEQVGQVNGLSVLQQNEFSFGRPNRITARVRLGKGEIIDIEREAALGGPLHSKGVLILSGFLSGRYAPNKPLSLTASLVFEQSFGGIEGDSASSAELYALLSAIADVPLKQSLAVTGSVNQHGVVQPIGGVNEKVEGFFDVCRSKGLTGNQGVLIPADNVKNLMLRQDVLEAAREGRFHIYPVETIDQGIELLTDHEAGTRDEQGNYPEGSFNARVERRLERLADQRRHYALRDGQAEEAAHE